MTQENSWSAVMRYCHFTLNIPPKDFWDMTMVEILTLIEEGAMSQKMTKKDLEYLIKCKIFPTPSIASYSGFKCSFKCYMDRG